MRFLKACFKSNRLLKQAQQTVNKKKGELIIANNDIFNDGKLRYARWDKKKKNFITYHFYLKVDKEKYDAFWENVNYYEYCIDNIDNLEKILENCSSPTIQKSRTVQVPYTYKQRIWNPGTAGELGSIGHDGVSSGSIGESGHYETVTRTAYREEVQYYTVANPDYNPEKVTAAKISLSKWQESKAATEEKIRYSPFELFLFPTSTDEQKDETCLASFFYTNNMDVNRWSKE